MWAHTQGGKKVILKTYQGAATRRLSRRKFPDKQVARQRVYIGSKVLKDDSERCLEPLQSASVIRITRLWCAMLAYNRSLRYPTTLKAVHTRVPTRPVLRKKSRVHVPSSKSCVKRFLCDGEAELLGDTEAGVSCNE